MIEVMHDTNIYQVMQLLAPILTAFMAGGGIVAYYKYRTDKPKTTAEANKINADVVVTFADGWKGYAERLENRMTELEARYEKNIKQLEERYEERISQLEQTIAYKEELHAQVIIEKDKRIKDLEDRVDVLESELAVYKHIEQTTGDSK